MATLDEWVRDNPRVWAGWPTQRLWIADGYRPWHRRLVEMRVPVAINPRYPDACLEAVHQAIGWYRQERRGAYAGQVLQAMGEVDRDALSTTL